MLDDLGAALCFNRNCIISTEHSLSNVIRVEVFAHVFACGVFTLQYHRSSEDWAVHAARPHNQRLQTVGV